MKLRSRLVVLLALFGMFVWGLGGAVADSGSDEHHEGSGEGSGSDHHEGSGSEHHEGSGSEYHQEGSAGLHNPGGGSDEGTPHYEGGGHHVDKVPQHEPGISDADATLDTDGDGTPDIEEVTQDEDDEADEDDPALKLLDADGDGVVEAEEVAENKEFDAELKEIDVDDNLTEAELEQDIAKNHPEDAELTPSITIDKWRKLVNVARKVVLGKMQVKMARKADKKMKTFSLIVVGVSGLGIFLLLAPLVLAKKYPGQGGTLFKYSALAALTFIVTVNLFGGVLFGMRTVQGALSGLTNPSLALAGGTFDTLHDDAEEYIVMGKDVFAPALKQMREHPDKQPTEILLDNSQRVLKDVKVFLSIKRMLKKIDFVFGVIPIVLTLLTLVLFVLAIRPTLTEIIKLPAQVAQGTSAGKDVVKKSIARVIGELKATVCTIGVLVVLTLISSFVLGQTVKPALAAFLEYFAKSINYLMFVDGSSQGLVFVAMFAVIVFLVLNLAALILSMAFFIGKCQKIFQQRFNEGTPLSTHTQFFKWGAPSVLLVQVFPMIFAFVVAKLLNAINDISGVKDAEQVSWTKALLMGPLVLVIAFLVLFWAVRGVAAIKFLAKYKVKVKTPPGVSMESEK